MGLLQRITALVVKATEGSYRPGPWPLPVTGGWLPVGVGDYANWWQLGYNPVGGVGASAMVEACISAYAQTVAMLPGSHWLANKKGGRDRVTTSALSRILRKPNSYQSPSDFMLNVVRSLFIEGNSYCLALRNDRYEIDELHLMNPFQSAPNVAYNGEIFYTLSGNDVIDRQLEATKLVVPQRDVLHIRLHTDRRTPRPLRGETPLTAALADIAAGQAMLQQQTQFYQNQARPSAILSTDLVLDKDQVQFLRDRWNDQVKGLHAGGTPILTAGLKVQPWAQSSKDAELAEVMKLTEAHIALAFRIPLAVLGIGGQPFASTELMMQNWIASGLGFVLNHIEESFGQTFNLYGQPDEYAEFDTRALLRSAFKDRIEALTRGVQGGIYSPNEARNEEDLPDAEYGDEPRVQQQVVPLSAAGAIPAAPGPGAPPSAAGTPLTPPSPPGSNGATPPGGGADKPTTPTPAAKASDNVRLEAKRLRDNASKLRRRFS